MKILVVDDSPTIRNVIKSELINAGYEVIEAFDGADALRQIMTHRDIDLVTLDIQMPVMDGYRTCEELLKEKYSEVFSMRSGKPLHILFVTGNDSLEGRKRGLELGAADFIGKNFIETELVSTVDKILKPSKRMENLRALIVDDSPTYLEIITRTLNQQGVITEKALNGKIAFEIISSNPQKFDMIVTDYVMPEMNGLTLTEKIRVELGLQDLPVIILSSASDKVTQIDFFKAGANDYITKPFIKEELLARLSVHLETVLLNKKLKRAILELKDRNRALIESKEQIESKNTQQKELLHVLCHDLANPIGSIISAMEMIHMFPEKKESLLPCIQTSANCGLEIISLVRKMRALEEGKINWNLEPINLRGAVSDSLSILRMKFENKKIITEFNISENINIIAELTSLINSVLNNIMTNAIKFSFKGGKIEMSATDDPDSQDEVILTIKDYGIGMSRTLLGDLFNINKATSRPGTEGEEGTGFGMPLVKKFMEAYNGEITITSKDKRTHPEDHGTEVALHFKKA